MVRLEAEEAWKSWLQKKNREIRQQKKQEDDAKRKRERDNRKVIYCRNGANYYLMACS